VNIILCRGDPAIRAPRATPAIPRLTISSGSNPGGQDVGENLPFEDGDERGANFALLNALTLPVL
jgi:hypothetical protein